MLYFWLNTDKSPHIDSLDMSRPIGHRIVYRDDIDSESILSIEVRRPWGIRLDSGDVDYLVVDIDSPDHISCCELVARLPETWAQKTRRGFHYLYTVPLGTSEKRKNLPQGSERKFDLKVKGYIVGPGSTMVGSDRTKHTYEVLNPIAPVEAPEWLIEMLPERAPDGRKSASTVVPHVPLGEHANWLYRQACSLRGQYSLSEHAIFEALRDQIGALQDYDELDPFTDDDLSKIASSACSHPAEAKIEIRVDDSGWERASEIDTSMPAARWLLHDFVPEHELTIIFGEGGVGKSTFASYLAAKVLRSGRSFGVSTREERFARFVVRTALSLTKEEQNLYLSNLYNIRYGWMFPRDAELLVHRLKDTPVDVLYFDSLRGSIFTPQGGDPNPPTRAALESLLDVIMRARVSIVGTSHTTKAGEMAGANELRQVPRQVLEATRDGGDFCLSIAKTNFEEVGYDLYFPSEKRQMVSLEGEPWVKISEEGEESLIETSILIGHRKSTEYTGDVQEALKEKVKELLSGGMSIRAIAAQLQRGKSRIGDIVKKIKAEEKWISDSDSHSHVLLD